MQPDSNLGRCDACNRGFAYRLVHSGFGSIDYLYCDTCGGTAFFSFYHPRHRRLFPRRDSGVKLQDVETVMKQCRCGGHFRQAASPRCPHCRATLTATACQEWIESQAPGTKGGWRWQNTWLGLYCIVIEENSVEDPWLDSGNLTSG